MLQGVDVSSYQPSYSTAGLDFVFIKVTQGLSYVNPDWVEQRATARNAGLVTGFYHYPTISNSASAEADYVLAQINLVPGDVLCLDWEWYGQSVADQQARDYKDAWIARVRAKAPGHRIVVYSDKNNWLTVDTDSNVGDGLWIATAGLPAGQPGIQHPWVFHQYSDSPLDLDVANFNTADDLRAWAEEMDTMPLSQDDINKVALAVWAFKNAQVGDKVDMHQLLGEVHYAVVEPTLASQIDGAKHTLGQHEVATNANAIQAHAAVDALTKAVAALAARVDAIAKKVGA